MSLVDRPCGGVCASCTSQVSDAFRAAVGHARDSSAGSLTRRDGETGDGETGRRMGLFRPTTPEQFAGAPFTYAEVGATRSPQLPDGYTHTERHAAVGAGRATWARAVQAVFGWQAQRGALRVRASGPA